MEMCCVYLDAMFRGHGELLTLQSILERLFVVVDSPDIIALAKESLPGCLPAKFVQSYSSDEKCAFVVLIYIRSATDIGCSTSSCGLHFCCASQYI